MKKADIIFMYHSIGGSDNREIGAGLYGVPVERFREQMGYLAGVIKAGTVPLGSSQKKGQSPEVPNRLAMSGTVPSVRESPCLLTFDDGLLDNYTIAFPVLKEFNLKAYFFVTVSKIDSIGYMSWEQLRELKNAGMVIGSHGMRHKILTELNNGELDYELTMSKKFLEFNLGNSVDYFSIPKGHHNKRVIEKIKEAGYRAVFTSDYTNSDGFVSGRIPVRSNWDFVYFTRVINNGLSFRDRAVGLIKSFAKRLFGACAYDNLRTHLLKDKVNS